MKLKVRGITYHFEIHQQQDDLPYLVLLHGFLGSGNCFAHIIPELKNFSNPITIDLLGHGETEGSELHYRFSTREQIADLSKLIAEQFSHPLFLYGYSMGGRLALQLAIQKPALFRGLILESSTFGIEHETERQARQALDAQKCDQIMGNYADFLKDWKKMPLFGKPVNNDILKKLHAIQEKQNPLWMANSLEAFGTGTMPCVRDELSNLKMPVQLIVGEEDSKFLHINRQMQREISDAKLEVVPDATHRVHVEQPEVVVKTLNEFIE